MFDTEQLEFCARALDNPGVYTAEERRAFATIVREAREALEAKALTAEDVQKLVRETFIDYVGAMRAVDHEFMTGALRFPPEGNGKEPEPIPDTAWNRLNRILQLLGARWGL